MPVKIFCCYAHEDEHFLKRLKAHLSPLLRQGLIEVWHDRDISAGSEWEKEISEHLNSAQLILLLISPDFMNSEYCYGIEMKKALEKHERGEARLIPIILDFVYWQIESLKKLQALPTDAKPVMSASWHTQNEAFYDVVQGILKVVDLLPPQQPKTHTVTSVEVNQIAPLKMVIALDRTGEVFGNYTLMRLIGKGGFGSVYLGIHKDIGTSDAVKVIDDPHLTPQNLQAFKDEAKRVHDLNGLSKHLIAFMEFGIRQPDNVPYFVTSYMSDGDITNRHTPGSIIAYKDIADYLDQLSDGLSVIHKAGLVHRDVKPSNILVNSQGSLVLTDLGIATQTYMVDTNSPLPPQSLIGTWEYAAPEHFVGRAIRKSDIYSLGILTYEWLCGDIPFHGIEITITGFIHDIALKHAKQAVPSFASHGVNVPIEIELVVMKALAKDPQDRYDTVEEFAKAFRLAMPSTGYQIQEAIQRPRVLPPTVPALSAPNDQLKDC